MNKGDQNMSVDIGIEKGDREKVAEALSKALAETYAIYMKTHGYHWNVTGPQFRTLHLMFEEQYRDMWAALDELAERIRALGVYAPGSGRRMAELSQIEEGDNDVPSADVMIANLTKDHEAIATHLRDFIEVADEADDDGTEDLLIARLQFHEKTAWMLRSMQG
ncbi:Dps family protein [Aquisalinus flavus]